VRQSSFWDSGSDQSCFKKLSLAAEYAYETKENQKNLATFFLTTWNK
jgi:hypothetical protein